MLALEGDRSHSHRVSINDHAWIWKEGGMCSVFYSAIPVFRYHEEDGRGKHIAMIHLVETGLAKASEVAEAFSVHRTTIFRSQKKVEQEGLSGLVEKKKGPKGAKKIKDELPNVIKKLKSPGLSNEAIGQRLGLSATNNLNNLSKHNIFVKPLFRLVEQELFHTFLLKHDFWAVELGLTLCV